MNDLPFRIGRVNETDSDRLARAVLASPRLRSVLPASEVEGLAAAHERASQAAREAAGLTGVESKVRREIDEILRSEQTVDVGDLLRRVGDAHTAEAQRVRLGDWLESLKTGYTDEAVSLVDEHLDDVWARLDADLDALLEEATEVVEKLGQADTAETAIKAGAADAWAELLRLAVEHGSIRKDHFSLLRAGDTKNFRNNSEELAFATWRGVGAAVQDFVRLVRGEIQGLDGQPMPVTVPVFAVGSHDHLLMSVRQRSVVRPWIGRASGAYQALSGTTDVVVGGNPSSLSPAQASATMQRIRIQAATRVADERREIAATMA
ncbi:UNVERIFIED_ORG: hypothetical protein E4P37_07930 [Bacillus sp. AZ43]